jgi:PHD-finger
MASKDGRIQQFERQGKKRPNPNEKDEHDDDNGNLLQLLPPETADILPSSTGCLVCGVDDDHANLLLCEECNGEFHTYCLTPKLDTVPEYDWFCGASFVCCCNVLYCTLPLSIMKNDEKFMIFIYFHSDIYIILHLAVSFYDIFLG